MIPELNTIDHEKKIIYVDNSILENYRSCKLKYEYRHLKNLVLTKHTPATYFGAQWHQAMHLYWGRFDPSTLEFESPAMLTRALMELSPYEEGMENEEKGKTSSRLLSGLREYSEKIDEGTGEVWDDLITSSTHLIAEEFISYPIMTWEGYTVCYCGIIDRVVEQQEKAIVIDFKTTSWNRLMDAVWAESPQFKGYIWLVNKRIPAVHTNLFVLDLFMMQSKINNRFMRRGIRFEDWVLEEWEEERIIEITEMLSMRRAYKEPHCSDYGECPYTSLCSQPPSVRDYLASIQYVVDPWTIHHNVGGGD